MSFSRNKAVIQQFYAAWNAQQMEDAAALIAPMFVDHVLPPDALQGRAGFRRAREQGARTLTDVTIVIDDLLDAENNRVVAIVTIHATQIGVYKEIPYDGVPRRISWPAISVMRVADGLLVEHWECADILPVLKAVQADIVVPLPRAPDEAPKRGAHIL